MAKKSKSLTLLIVLVVVMGIVGLSLARSISAQSSVTTPVDITALESAQTSPDKDKMYAPSTVVYTENGDQPVYQFVAQDLFEINLDSKDINEVGEASTDLDDTYTSSTTVYTESGQPVYQFIPEDSETGLSTTM